MSRAASIARWASCELLMQFNGVFLDAAESHRLGIPSHTIVNKTQVTLMKLPQKDHFSLCELAERWNAPVADVQYYAAHGMLKVQAWLSMPSVRIEHDGNALAVARFDDYDGYAVVKVKDLRKIFRNDETHHHILAADLVISREERDRFEATHGLEHRIERQPANRNAHPLPESFSGRAGTMWRIVWHFQERCRDKMVHETLQQESIYLATWAENNIQAQTPKAKSIRNAIRAKYRAYLAGAANGVNFDPGLE